MYLFSSSALFAFVRPEAFMTTLVTIDFVQKDFGFADIAHRSARFGAIKVFLFIVPGT